MVNGQRSCTTFSFLWFFPIFSGYCSARVNETGTRRDIYYNENFSFYFATLLYACMYFINCMQLRVEMKNVRPYQRNKILPFDSVSRFINHRNLLLVN